MEKSADKKRFHWLADKINEHQYSAGAEVGCRAGTTTGHILKNCPSLDVLYAVDMWGVVPKRVQTEYWKSVHAHTSPGRFRNMRIKFNKAIHGFEDRVVVLQGLSWEMAREVVNGTLDFVFIDADHAYQSVTKDIISWLPKLNAEGLLCGHDVNILGVEQAINELVPNWRAAHVANIWYCYINQI